MGKLDGKVALITGASRSQGESHARLFVAEGAKVAVTDVLDDEGTKVAADLGEHAIWCHLDVSSAADWAVAVEATVAAFGRLDILVNNAGIFPMGNIEDMAEDDFMQVIRVNQLGTWLGMKSVIAPMRASGGGSIINIASAAGLTGIPGMSAYVGSKHAVRGMSKTAAAELGHDGIRVNSIYPGAIFAEGLIPGVTDEMADAMFAELPVPRVGRPIETSRAALYFASDDSAYCTGSELQVDGGSLAAGMTSPTPPAQ
jgi:3alpha(or 20beta)-hydroxysteroid dehydrogenase